MTDMRQLAQRLEAAADIIGKPTGRHMVEGMKKLAAVQAQSDDDPDAVNLSHVIDTLACCIESEAKLFDDLAAVAKEAAIALNVRPRAQLIQIGNDARISRDMVASLEWRRPTYANAASTSTLVITLKDGRVFKVDHRPHNSHFPQDAYAIERELLGDD